MGILRLRASGYVRRDVLLSAVGNAVWGTGKGHGGKGRLARPLQTGANETMRRDELIVGGNGKGKGEGLKEGHCWRVRGRRGIHEGAAQEVRGEEPGQVLGHPFLQELTDRLISWHRNSHSQQRPSLPTPRSFCKNLSLREQ